MLKRKYNPPKKLNFRIKSLAIIMTINVNTFGDFFYITTEVAGILASGDLAGTKMKMKYLNVPLLCNEEPNLLSQKEANKRWLIYKAGLLSHVSFHFHWICHIHQQQPASGLVDLVNGYWYQVIDFQVHGTNLKRNWKKWTCCKLALAQLIFDRNTETFST